MLRHNPKIKTLVLSSITCCLIVVGSASAQSVFSQADRDNNNVIDREEFRDHMMETFYHADENKDGHLSEDELSALNAKRLNSTDSDGNGSVSLNEFLNATGADFDTADKNNDNNIAESEL